MAETRFAFPCDCEAATALAIKILEDYQWDQLKAARRHSAAGHTADATLCERESEWLQTVIDGLEATRGRCACDR